MSNIIDPHSLTSEKVLRHFGVKEKIGLTQSQIEKQREIFGKNEIPHPPATSFLKLVLSQFSDLLVLILLGAAVISFILALFEDSEDRLTAFVEPAVILIILICNATVGVLQESNAEKAIEKLKESEARHATVLRAGRIFEIDSIDLVPGDIIHVAVGDKVPADARLVALNSATLLVDEATLTGESEAANKTLDVITKPKAVNQDKRNMLFSGTLVVRGKATAVVTAIGASTEMGAIASDLSAETEKTPLQEKLDEFGEQLSKVIAVICLAVWLMNIGHFTDPEYGSVFKGAIYYFKIAVALAVAAIPEGLPAVVTTCLALGTMKMAKKNAIVRSLPSVETLGCTTVICSDKTGTLTTNMMSVVKVLTVDNVTKAGKITLKDYTVEGDSWSPEGRVVDDRNQSVGASEDASLAEISKISCLCNEASLGYRNAEGDKQGGYTKTGAPTEAALLVLAEKIGTDDVMKNKSKPSDPHDLCQFAQSYWNELYTKEQVLEFDRDRKSMSVICRDPNAKRKDDLILFCKGAPESILPRCTTIQSASGAVEKLSAAAVQQIEERMREYALEGLRCLALSYTTKVSMKHDFTDMARYTEIENDMTFCGLAMMLDPPRAAVSASISKCRQAGIKVVVITGDNPTTAESICRRIGVFDADENLKNKSFTGSEFEHMSESQKMKAVETASLFSRVEPKHKLELVTLLKQQGHVVAMTGDGVNDSTALRKADIGIAMGSGTDVAREASKMVLQDDNFATIVMAVEEGRAIYANTKQFIRYLISSNIGEVACIFLTATLGIPEALIPVQLLWVNLVTDGLPATALGFNPPDQDIMSSKPRGRTEAIINGWMFFRYMAVGIYVGLGTVGGFLWWFLFAENGPKVSYWQLTHFHDCAKGLPGFEGLNCEIFHDARPSTVSLSILVTIEMFNAMNALSENQSLLRTTPFSNIYVILACLLSFALHFMIVYIPFFSTIFHTAPLNKEEWLYVLYLSFPVIVLDEALKFISRNVRSAQHTETKQIKKTS